MDSNLIVQKPELFFQEKIREAATASKLELTENIEYYLVNLLCDFISPSTNPNSNESNPMATPLALLLKEALEANPTEKIKKYKTLGDISLYYAGYFGDYVKKSPVNINYYVAIGSQAYSSAATIIGKSYAEAHFSEVYSTLSEKFRILVQILSLVSLDQKNSHSKEENLISLYKNWIETDCHQSKEKLQAEGIEPIKINLNKH